jgi:hypothetical protein
MDLDDLRSMFEEKPEPSEAEALKKCAEASMPQFRIKYNTPTHIVADFGGLEIHVEKASLKENEQFAVALAIAEAEAKLTRNCERCERSGATKQPSLTAYEWDGKGEDPNRDPWLCEECAEDHREHWKNMWDEYNQGRI